MNNKPWGYKEGFIVCAGFFIIGTLLNVIIGKTNLSMLAFPVNIFLLGFFMSALAVMHLSTKRIYLFRWMSSYSAAVTAIISLVAITIFMGLIRQLPPEVEVTGIRGWLGFSQMLSSWSFTLIMVWFITILGMVIFKRLSRFKLHDIPFIFNHLGLFITLVAAILGNADMKRLKTTISEGNTEWRAVTRSGVVEELPFSIELHDFSIDEYPPKLMLVDNETGKAIPQDGPVNLSVEDGFERGELLDWQISVLRHIPEAARMATKDTLLFAEYNSAGAAYALLVETENINTGAKKTGWVSCGSFMFPKTTLNLDGKTTLFMPDREPRRYASDITVTDASGKKERGTIEVNHPFAINGWNIYQVSYDQRKGRWSEISIFELVRDPWLPAVYVGIFMMLAGAVCMFIFSPKPKEDAK